jgi:hypothetical protein
MTSFNGANTMVFGKNTLFLGNDENQHEVNIEQNESITLGAVNESLTLGGVVDPTPKFEYQTYSPPA